MSRCARVLAACLVLCAAACAKEAAPAAADDGTAAKPVTEKPATASEIKVAGASDLIFAMDELGPMFEKQTGTKVVFIPGSSGKLAEQIQQGAPFDVFLSANVGFVDKAIESGACAKDTRALYAYGRLVMWTREGGPKLPATLDGLADPAFVKIAIGQPEHAPYGAAAKAALEKLGKWEALSSRMVYGSNIKDTMQMAETGNADVALIALSLAKKSKGTYVEVPADAYPPIEQGMATCKGSDDEAARAFVAFLRSKEARDLLAGYGFGLPE
jgi:molybdate transport system substrate-binding protein